MPESWGEKAGAQRSSGMESTARAQGNIVGVAPGLETGCRTVKREVMERQHRPALVS